MDDRPAVWIGHAALYVSDVRRSGAFWRDLGMREVHQDDDVTILELRGGTHLVIVAGDRPESGEAPFDLMVDDVEATHAQWRDRGLDVSDIERGRIHSAFTLTDPDGYRVTINSTHVIGSV